MYVSLDNSSYNATNSVDSNGITVFTHNANADFNTEWFGLNKEDKTVFLTIITSGFNGTATLTWQHSSDKAVVFDLVNSVGTTVALSLDGTPANDYFINGNYPFCYHRLAFSKGTNSSGTIKILLDK